MRNGFVAPQSENSFLRVEKMWLLHLRIKVSHFLDGCKEKWAVQKAELSEHPWGTWDLSFCHHPGRDLSQDSLDLVGPRTAKGSPGKGALGAGSNLCDLYQSEVLGGFFVLDKGGGCPTHLFPTQMQVPRLTHHGEPHVVGFFFLFG